MLTRNKIAKLFTGALGDKKCRNLVSFFWKEVNISKTKRFLLNEKFLWKASCWGAGFPILRSCVQNQWVAPRSTHPFIFPRPLKRVPRISGNLVVKSKLPPWSDSRPWGNWSPSIKRSHKVFKFLSIFFFRIERILSENFHKKTISILSIHLHYLRDTLGK